MRFTTFRQKIGTQDEVGQFYEVEFENGRSWACSEDEIGRPTKAKTNNENEKEKKQC